MSDIRFDGSGWYHGALGRRHQDKSKTLYLSDMAFDDRSYTVLSLLECDGRVDSATASRRLNLGPAQARRIVRRLLGSRQIAQRVEAAHMQDQWPGVLVLWMMVSAHRLLDVSRRIEQIPGARLCATLVGGGANLYVVTWLKSLRDAAETEAEIVSDLPVRVVDRSLVLQYFKRMGVLIDHNGRRIGHVPWVQDSSQPVHEGRCLAESVQHIT